MGEGGCLLWREEFLLSGWVTAAFEAFSGVHGSLHRLALPWVVGGLSGSQYPSALVFSFERFIHAVGSWGFGFCSGFILEQMYMLWIGGSSGWYGLGT
jgi:hypothetical protein